MCFETYLPTLLLEASCHIHPHEKRSQFGNFPQPSDSVDNSRCVSAVPLSSLNDSFMSLLSVDLVASFQCDYFFVCVCSFEVCFF